MQYLKFTHIDAITGVPVTEQPARNGPVLPAVVGLVFEWARESQYPTPTPHFFGTCPDDSSIDVPGVLAEYTQYDYGNMQADEMATRPTHDKSLKEKIAALERAELLPRVAREGWLGLFAMQAAAAGADPMTMPAYVKLKAFDDQIAALRDQLGTQP